LAAGNTIPNPKGWMTAALQEGWRSNDEAAADTPARPSVEPAWRRRLKCRGEGKNRQLAPGLARRRWRIRPRELAGCQLSKCGSRAALPRVRGRSFILHPSARNAPALGKLTWVRRDSVAIGSGTGYSGAKIQHWGEWQCR